MANSDKNILITPNVGAATGTNPTIRFTGADNTPITLRVLDNGTVSFEGTAGQLFSVSDGLTGTIFSVNDISGIPSLEILDTGLVKLNQYNGQTAIGGAAAVSTARLTVYPSAAASLGLVIRGFASQTANLQEWQNSGGTVLSSIDSSGRLYVNTTTNYFASIQAVAYTPGAHALRLVGSSSGTTSVAESRAGAAGQSPLVAVGFASQTADLQQWQNSAGSVLAYVRNDGFLLSSAGIQGTPFVSAGSFISGAQLISNVGTATNIGVLVRGAASQTANLQEWQNSSATILSRIDNNGNLFATVASIGGTGISSGNLRVVASATTIVPITARGAASQTANLQEWQNSGGTVLARVNSSGQFVGDGSQLTGISAGANEIMVIMGAY